ncbi:MAG: cytochrome b/b6 domain-containing protein [Nitrospinae bacterium]|nr:cytochrome b/b6 domain-containing protein [Nitrospinota bacterium]MBF0634516.1 cytochrome b/b6 domain-containing protein [Nitrospinota bacterium]
MNTMITRFTPSERWLHNVVMLTFIALLMTGMGMLAYNIQGDQGPSRQFLVAIHKYISLVFLIAPFLLVVLGNRRIWKENFHLLTSWGRKDIEWLMKKPLASIFSNIELPPDDKFNPGQKSWATLAVSGSLVLAATGIIMWVTGSPILALIVHTLVAVGLAFALSGHIFMAVGNKDTRPSITSIIDGQVDAHWATHHHPLWMERETRRRIREQAGAATTHHYEKAVGYETKKIAIPNAVKPAATKASVESKGATAKPVAVVKPAVAKIAVEPKAVGAKQSTFAKPAADSKPVAMKPNFAVGSVIKIPKNDY